VTVDGASTGLSPGHSGQLVDSIANFRDLGGYPTGDGGQVMPGLVFRSGDLSHATPEHVRILASLGIRAVFDLRSAQERAVQPDRVPNGAGYQAFDVLRDAVGITTADYERLIADPPSARAALGGGRGAILWRAKFNEFVELPSARDGFGRLFLGLAEGNSRPAIIHCSTGVNRTGWAVAALLLLLGVPDEVIVADYMESGSRLAPTIRPILDAFRAKGGDPELIEPLVGVRRENIRAAIEQMRRHYSTVERYFTEGLGVPVSTQRALRIALVDGGTRISR
jgi:protein-tyrosine phosphatase